MALILCGTCGKENQGHYKFCLGCGAELAAVGSAPALGSAVVPEAKPGCVTLRMHVECERCAAPIPVNGPAQRMPCKACLAENDLSGLLEALHDASRGLHALGSRYDVTIIDGAEPECVSCNAATPVDASLDPPKSPGVVPCARCGHGVPSYPAPAWIRAALPTAAWVFGGDPELLPPESGIVLDVPERDAKPVAMACPQCNGGLTITKDNARIVPCRFCGVDVYLPDELWRRLHPVATKRAWTLIWSAPGLVTAAELAEREQASRAAEDSARRRAAPPPLSSSPPRRSSGAAMIVVIAALVFIAAGAAFALAL